MTAGRREFLVRAARTSAGLGTAVLLPWTTACAGVPMVTPGVVGRSARIPLSAFGDAPGVLFRHPEEELPVYVHRHDDGRFTAVSTRCTHRGCRVEVGGGDGLVCPCHGSRYGLDGALLGGPAERPLVAFPTSWDDAHVTVGLEAVRRPS